MPLWFHLQTISHLHKHLQDQTLCIALSAWRITSCSFDFPSVQITYNTMHSFMTQVTFCFPMEHKNNIQQIWLIKDFYLTWESNVGSLSYT